MYFPCVLQNIFRLNAEIGDKLQGFTLVTTPGPKKLLYQLLEDASEFSCFPAHMLTTLKMRLACQDFKNIERISQE